jgi:hypothetical protein
MISLEEIVRKMLLLGIPIVPVGCFEQWSSCPDQPPPAHEQIVEVLRPGVVDGGTPGVTEASFRRCADDDDCLALCKEHFRFFDVKSCVRVPDDAGADGGPQRASVFVRAQVVTICEGRRPEGYVAAAGVAAPCELGAWLAEAAHVEALSVPAFERLGRELRAHGAPAALVQGAARSAREERRHTRMMAALARRHGVRVARPTGRLPGHVRALEALATENAVEGCVRETLGALVARWQAGWASDGRIRAAMTVIARDEAKHAELAWQIDAWASARLAPDARARVAAARANAFALLEGEIQRSAPGPALTAAAGMPSAADTARLARALQSTLA